MIAALLRARRRRRDLHALRAEIADLKRWTIHDCARAAGIMPAVTLELVAGFPRPVNYQLIAERHADLAGLAGESRAALAAALEECLASALNVAAATHVAQVMTAARRCGVRAATRDGEGPR